MTWVIDGANVVGAKPDGWWKDRRAAAERLRDHLARHRPAFGARLVLVLEGAARGVASTPEVEVVDAPDEGDDAIVLEVLAAAPPVTVVTADRGLAERVRAHGAEVVGPGQVWRLRTPATG
ncbi:MAG: NTP pyrophosphohydrolase [Myxococcota bacterium]